MNSNLDSSQKEAVCCGRGPCEVIAGPGSGKTSVLTERILYLIEQEGIDPALILVLTFSRAAATQMKERFLSKSHGRFTGVRFGTFHSVFFYILKESTGKDYSLLKDSVKEALLGRLLQNYYRGPNERPTVEELEKALHTSSPVSENARIISAVRRDYEAYKRENSILDYDDMIIKCRTILTGNTKAREYWKNQFRAILVDEFQDVNSEQYEVLKLLTDGNRLFVVGDDDQSIYGFRGSSPAIMKRFMDDFQGSRRIALEFNYRCSANICRASGRMIAANKERIAKKVQAAKPAGDKVILKGLTDESEQLAYLLNELRKLPAAELAGTAVITRTNYHASKIRDYLCANAVECAGKNTPSRMIRETIVRDITHYRFLAAGMTRGALPRQSLFRVMNRPERFILRSVADGEWMTPTELMINAARQNGSKEALEEFLDDLRVLGTLSPEGFIRYLFFSMGYAGWAEERLGNRQGAVSSLREILKASSRFTDCGAMLESFAKEQGGEESGTGRGLHIMTMHACKGLEFDRVYLPSLNEGIIPGRRCRTEADIEEERRLLYVAMTRAKSRLELLYLAGTGENPRPPSRFLSVYGIRSFVYS